MKGAAADPGPRSLYVVSGLGLIGVGVALLTRGAFNEAMTCMLIGLLVLIGAWLVR